MNGSPVLWTPATAAIRKTYRDTAAKARTAGGISQVSSLQQEKDVEKADTVLFSEEAAKSIEEAKAAEAKRAQAGQDLAHELSELAKGSSSTFTVSSSPPSDSSSELTQRLVGAFGQFEVRMVAAKANSNLVSLRMVAATATGKDKELALRYIRKLEKLLSRASRKIEDLDNEDNLRLQQTRAASRKQEARAQEIKNELRKRQADRLRREQQYLRDIDDPDKLADLAQAEAARYNPEQKLDAATEAQIAAQAEAQAATEVAAGGDGGDGGDAAVGGEGAPAAQNTSASGVEATGGAEGAAEG